MFEHLHELQQESRDQVLETILACVNQAAGCPIENAVPIYKLLWNSCHYLDMSNWAHYAETIIKMHFKVYRSITQKYTEDQLSDYWAEGGPLMLTRLSIEPDIEEACNLLDLFMPKGGVQVMTDYLLFLSQDDMIDTQVPTNLFFLVNIRPHWAEKLHLVQINRKSSYGLQYACLKSWFELYAYHIPSEEITLVFNIHSIAAELSQILARIVPEGGNECYAWNCTKDVLEDFIENNKSESETLIADTAKRFLQFVQEHHETDEEDEEDDMEEDII